MHRIFKNEEAASLAAVMLLLVGGAIVALAISFRTVQDIRRAGEEKASSNAGTIVESILDTISSPGNLDLAIGSVGCESAWANGLVCEISESELENLFFNDPHALDDCDVVGAQMRAETGIEGIKVNKDDVMEINLEGMSMTQVCVNWSGSDYLSINFFRSPGCVEDDCVAASYMLAKNNNDGMSGITPAAAGSCTTISATSDPNRPPTVMRIRPIGGDASVTLSGSTNLPSYIADIRAYCYTYSASGDRIYRESIRRVHLNPSVPACFDYVLFSSDDQVVK